MFGRAEQVFPARIHEDPNIPTRKTGSIRRHIVPFLNQNNGTHGLVLIAMSTQCPFPHHQTPSKYSTSRYFRDKQKRKRKRKQVQGSAPPEYSLPLHSASPRVFPPSPNSKSPNPVPCTHPHRLCSRRCVRGTCLHMVLAQASHPPKVQPSLETSSQPAYPLPPRSAAQPPRPSSRRWPCCVRAYAACK